MTAPPHEEVRALVRRAAEHGGLPADDVLAAFLPLCREALALHERGLVAALDGLGALVLRDAGLGLDPASATKVERADERVAKVLGPAGRAFAVIGESNRLEDLDEGRVEVTDLGVLPDGAEVLRPAFVRGFSSWEQRVGHHDELTDVFSLGQILASLACGLDLDDVDDLRRLAAHRQNPFALNPRIHPVVAAAIRETTELDRRRRAQDLPSLVRRLETYREQPTDLDLSRIQGLATASPKDRRSLLLGHLQERLFDLSRRNRLLHFRPSAASVNLTIASVPLVLDRSSIRPEQLFTWNEDLAREATSCKPLSLGRWLRFEDQPWVPPSLDKLIGDERRDRSEFGFSQLRLVVAFLRWHDLKEAPDERIHSPLLLLPVTLVKKKGVRDQYLLQATDSSAEVNPVLRHRLRQLYGLELPESIDLAETTAAAFHATLRSAIRASEPGIELLLVDRPEIELVHAKARQRMDRWKRRALPRAGATGKVTSEGGYRRGDLRPRGLALFLAHVRLRPAPLRDVIDEAPVPRAPRLVAGDAPDPEVREVKREQYVLRQGEHEGSGNPYTWELDLCAVTLANFNYRKMTLVRDYSHLLGADRKSPAFDEIFSREARPAPDAAPPATLADRHLVIPADATQVGAIDLARTGASCIVQGPPGTGKSQTITNVIADYVARGKRVLFVCEKRAAIDVVHHRLRQQGLDELCVLIHDSQADKKEFIQDLKRTSETWLESASAPDDCEARRASTLTAIERELAALRSFSEAMGAVRPDAGLPLRALLDRLVARGVAPTLSARDEDRLPGYAAWREHSERLLALGAALEELGSSPVFARHPFRRLAPELIAADAPLDELLVRLDRAESLLDALERGLASTPLARDAWSSFEKLDALLGFALAAAPFARSGHLSLLDRGGAAVRRFDALATRCEEAARTVTQRSSSTTGWRDKPGETVARDALAVAKRYEGVWWAFLSPRWRRLRKDLSGRRSGASGPGAARWSRLLADVVAEHEAIAAHDEALGTFAAEFGTRDVGQLRSGLAEAARRSEAPDVAPVLDAWVRGPEGARWIEVLARIEPQRRALRSELEGIFLPRECPTLGDLGEALRDLREASDDLPDLLAALRDLLPLPERLLTALRELEIPCSELEAAMGERSLRDAYRADRALARFDGRVLARRTERLAALHGDLLAHNAAVIRGRTRRRYLEHVKLSTMSVTQLDERQRAMKRAWSQGRRLLEHEFGKTMRYKSIRELASGDAGEVVRDLKPIWLMSPLSVSDTLPLEGEPFDVVIFDEASQIPLEEAVPALHRAPQAIVVGDEMQLPPTTFFSAGRDPSDEEDAADGDGAERIAVELEADSFLTQCTRNLRSTLLAWHYRSRHEALIHFSNVSFYGGELRTVPDREIPPPDRPELLVVRAEDARGRIDDVLSRSISFHRCTDSTYEERKNPVEAAYIAELVRAFLARETGQSLGVVAFSEAQQAEIETALAALASTDADFARRLEAETTREKDHQFCGLIVKNLENVQGDERDVIVLSICYGPDRQRRIRMSFGPINQHGGEKRLNVIFSRAKQHMVVVSSLRHQDITNDWNDGAAALKAFLKYAELVSAGDLAGARLALDRGQASRGVGGAAEVGSDAIGPRLATCLRDRGWEVSERVGSSLFRCDLAVRSKGEGAHRLAVLVDTAAHYGVPDLIERYVMQPAVLRAFGWDTAFVLAKDWWNDREGVLARLERRLRGDADEPAPVDEDARSDEPAAPSGRPGPHTAPAAPAALAAPVPASTSIGFRRFELVEGASRRYWEIRGDGSEMIVRYGRIGTKGQMQSKTFESPERAAVEVEKLVREKLKKGYTETGASAGST